MRHRLPLLVVLAALLGCDAPVSDGPVALNRLRAQPTAYELNTVFEEAEEGVARTQSEWNTLYGRINGRHVPRPTEGPTLRFRDSTIVYVGIGWYPWISHNVVLDSALVDDGTLVVHYTVKSWESCGGLQATISPVDVAQVPQWYGPVRFERHDIETVCG